jgi:choline dehydrogenase-like flavoprotein
LSAYVHIPDRMTDGAGMISLSRANLRTLEVLARVVVPQARVDGLTEANMPALIDARLLTLPPTVVSDLRLAVRVIANPVVRWLVTGQWRRWERLSDAQRADAFARWGTSSHPWARTVHQAIRRFLLSTYFGSGAAHDDIGVLPPLHARAPVVAWEGPLPEEVPGGVVAMGSRRGSPPAPSPSRLRAHVMAGRVLRGSQQMTADAVVIGSGAGGAVIADQLSAAGRDVLVLEAGPFLDREDFTEDETHLLPRLFADGGTRATTDQAFSLLQGAAVGGGTTINWMVMLRTPEHVIDEWQRRFGLTDLTPARLQSLFDRIESRLQVARTPDVAHSPGNRLLLDGARQLGWRAESVPLNAHGCMRAGTCSLGCRWGAKQNAVEVFLPAAVARGARIVAEARATRVHPATAQGPARVHAVTLNTKTGERVGELEIAARTVVLAAGAVETPALLQRSGLGGDDVGRFLRLHPTTAVLGLYPETTYPLAGIPLSVMCDEFASTVHDGYGFWLECPALGPMLAASIIPGFGQAHRQRMIDLHRTVPIIAITRDGADPEQSNGQVRVDRRGRPRIDYVLGPRDQHTVRQSIEAAVRIHLARGAEHVCTLHHTPQVIHSEADLPALRQAPVGPNQLTMASAHVNGTCRLSNDRRTGAVSPEGERYGAPGIFVADGSLLPTAPGVNPQETIMALATHVGEAIAARR